MYQNIYVKRTKTNSEVHIWDDKTGYSKFQYKPYAYLKSQSGTYRSLYGDKLKKVNFWTGEDLQKGSVFESDIPIETRVLVDNYTDSEDVSEGHREVYFDIEVEVKDGFPDPKRADNKITAIALYDKVSDKYSCYVLGDVPNTDVVESFKSEEELLQRFYQKYLEINPTILSGWNIDGFDIPYLYNRTKRVMGDSFARSLSPIGEVFYSEHKSRYKIAGVSCLDYLSLYKKFTYTQQSSYRLDFIGQLEVNIGKIEYEGTLQDLYENDLNKYIEYNLNDVKIVKALDDKLKLIELVRGISHVGHTPYEDVYHSSRYLEGAILVYLKKLGVIAPNKALNARDKMNRSSDDKFTGAYVKDPKPGRYEWVFDLDLTSMYPSTIMTLNISPEMKIGKINGWNAKEFIKNTPKTYSLEKNGKEQGHMNNEELASMFMSNKVSISSNGILYRNDKKGLIPSILSKWFDERVEYKRLMKKYGDEGNDEQYGYFKRRQHVQKIVLNSLYGVLGLPVFRFYDIDNAEATTTTGQDLIKFTEEITNKYYNKKLNTKEDYCIYTDTDSVFYPAVPLIQHEHPDVDLTNDKFMTEKILETANVVQEFINKSYDLFAKKFLNCDTHRFDIKQETIAKSAFWVTKKRYGQWIINDGGIVCDRLDVKGLDIVRSSFPPAMRKLMTGVLQDILGNVDKDSIDKDILKFKKEMKTSDIQDIALPTGVRGITKFTDKRYNNKKIYGEGSIFTDTLKGAPVHVKSAIIYNDLLKYFGLNNVEKIRSAEKIKWVYLKPNSLNVQQIAFKGYDDPPQIMDFIKENIDYDKLFEKALFKKIKVFYEAMNWELPVDKINTLERFF
jgi:DNA polymerase elongation subunit (family B)